MTLFYVRQFSLYYGGRAADGAIVFANSRSNAVALRTREAAEALCAELGSDVTEVEERTLGASPSGGSAP